MPSVGELRAARKERLLADRQPISVLMDKHDSVWAIFLVILETEACPSFTNNGLTVSHVKVMVFLIAF